MQSTGGDGITLMGDGTTPSSRVRLKDLDVRRAYRNGLSVISATDVLVEDCAFSETCANGVANYGGPCCGIDCESSSSLAGFRTSLNKTPMRS